ncbi:hypothetical protein ABVV53_14370 [Novosphingobium sp. RD2P27]|uniref:Phage shock protein B n=1 Tax=Novosphingobium kalidii TaxID=3230299 RepID=A0ABV2D442_9SPHN
MSFGTAIVVIVAIAAVTWLRAQKNRGGHGSPPHDAELEREVEQLRQRIAVLERIAIEERDGDRLAREIEALRD